MNCKKWQNDFQELEYNDENDDANTEVNTQRDSFSEDNCKSYGRKFLTKSL